MSPQLSIVIIGRNEGQRLIDCIQSVQTMYYPSTEMEIIYVDSDSTDGSPQRAQALGVHVEIVHPQRPAAAIGRNAGWRVAKAPFILFLDGDTVLHPNFVKAALQAFKEKPNLAIIRGHLRERHPDASIYQRILDLDWLYPTGLTEVCGGNAIMRRHVLEEIDGYNPLLIAGEESEMCARIRARGYTILHIDHPMVLHDLAITRWTQYWRRTTRTGHAYAEVSNLLRNTATPLWQQETRKNFLHANVLLDIFMVGVILTFWFHSPWPLFLSMTLLVLLCLRSAWKARWKSNDWLTLLLYGVHCQFQHIPIALGQLSYYYYHGLGKRRRLVEYK